jgi:DNA polymerase III subunit beta
MKIKFKVSSLLALMQVVASAVQKTAVLPVLEHVRIDAKGGEVTLVGTDLTMTAIASTEIDVQSEGATLVSASKLISLLAALPKDSEGSLQSNDGKAVLRSGKSRFTLSTLNPVLFPKTENRCAASSVLSFSGADLKSSILSVFTAAAVGDVRTYLNGVLITNVPTSEKDDPTLKVAIVATDGHRVHKVTMPIKEKLMPKFRANIPIRVIKTIERLIDVKSDVSLSFDDNSCVIEQSHFRLQATLLVGVFPDFERLFKLHDAPLATFDKITLLKQLARVEIMSSERYRGVQFSQAGTVFTLESNSDGQEAEIEVEGIVSCRVHDCKIAINVDFLRDAVASCPTTNVSIQTKGSGDPMFIASSNDRDYVALIAPMRI